MKCAWLDFLAVVPPRMRHDVDKLGKDKLEELHLRIGQPVELVIDSGSCFLQTNADAEDIQFAVNTASRYSPWSAASMSEGYITAPGGHRIGLCGECVVQAGMVTGIRRATSICIRVARAFPGIGKDIPKHGSVLLLGPPGVGKTTLLRDIIRTRSHSGQAVAVVDERRELFPDGNIFESGPRTDVLTGCKKAQGIDMALRTMGPKCIAVDEITAAEDCQALVSAGWCGVDLLATAHAANCNDLRNRKVYRPLAESGLFEQAIILGRDKSWHMERM